MVDDLPTTLPVADPRAGRSTIEVIAGILAIFVFVTGVSSLPQLVGVLRGMEPPEAPGVHERHPRDEAARYHGYEPCSAIQRARVRSGDHEDHEFVLCKGQRHLVLGSGGEACRDLDIEVYGPDRELIKADRTRGRHPAVFFRTSARGAYRVRVINESCPAVRCEYMIRMYARRG